LKIQAGYLLKAGCGNNRRINVMRKKCYILLLAILTNVNFLLAYEEIDNSSSPFVIKQEHYRNVIKKENSKVMLNKFRDKAKKVLKKDDIEGNAEISAIIEEIGERRLISMKEFVNTYRKNILEVMTKEWQRRFVLDTNCHDKIIIQSDWTLLKLEFAELNLNTDKQKLDFLMTKLKETKNLTWVEESMLQKISHKFVPELMKEFEETNEYKVRDNLLFILKDCEDISIEDRMIEFIENELSKPNSALGIRATMVLDGIGGQKTYQFYLKKLQGTDPSLREKAFTGIEQLYKRGVITQDEIRKLAEKMSQDESITIRRIAKQIIFGLMKQSGELEKLLKEEQEKNDQSKKEYLENQKRAFDKAKKEVEEKNKIKQQEIKEKKAAELEEKKYFNLEIEQLIQEIEKAEEQKEEFKLDRLFYALESKKIQTQKERDMLVDVLKNTSWRLQVTAINLLAEQKKSVKLFIKLLKDDNNDISLRNNISIALGKIGDEEAAQTLVDELIKALGKNSIETDLSLYEGFFKITNKKAVPVLINNLENNSNHARAYIATVLGNIGDILAVNPLLKALDKEMNEYAKLGIAYGLLKLGNQEGINTFLELLKETEINYLYNIDDLVNSFVETVKLTPEDFIALKITPEDFEVKKSSYKKDVEFKEALMDGYLPETFERCLHESLAYKVYLKHGIISRLSQCNNIKANEILVELLNNEQSRYTKLFIAISLLRINDKQGLDIIVESLKDNSKAVREIAINALMNNDPDTLWKYAPDEWKKHYGVESPEYMIKQ
jgi:HEAT repeat protein